MVWELLDIFRSHEMHSLISTLDIPYFKDFCVVAKHVRGHLEW